MLTDFQNSFKSDSAVII